MRAKTGKSKEIRYCNQEIVNKIKERGITLEWTQNVRQKSLTRRVHFLCQESPSEFFNRKKLFYTNLEKAKGKEKNGINFKAFLFVKEKNKKNR